MTHDEASLEERPVRALVVDDEPVARASLCALLQAVPWVECIGSAADGDAAIAEIKANSPELVFLDIEMPGANGLDVIAQSGGAFAVIFTTAHDDYAMTAFELGAIDYLRKPFGPARLSRALERARVHLEAQRRLERSETVVPLGERLAFAKSSSRPLSRVFVRDRGVVVPIRTQDIVRCEADGDYVALHAAGRRYLVYLNLADLSSQLDGDTFVRVHRSHVVNLDFVQSLAPYDSSRLEVRMRDGSRVVASRTGTRELRQRMGGAQ